MKKFTAAIMLFSLLLFSSCTDKEKPPGTLALRSVEITRAFSWNGVFPEDGSDSVKENVFAIEVKNISGKDIKFIRLSDNDRYVFELTTLPRDKTAVVFEKSAAAFPGEGAVSGIKEANTVYFTEELSLREDVFALTASEGFFSIENISGSDINGGIYVYYKKKADDKYFGGITYRVKTEGLLEGEQRQLPASHFSVRDCEIMFTDYAD